MQRSARFPVLSWVQSVCILFVWSGVPGPLCLDAVSPGGSGFVICSIFWVCARYAPTYFFGPLQTSGNLQDHDDHWWFPMSSCDLLNEARKSPTQGIWNPNKITRGWLKDLYKINTNPSKTNVKLDKHINILSDILILGICAGICAAYIYIYMAFRYFF